MLYYLVTALYILVCLTMMLVVYLQQGKGGDIASAFGGGSSQAAFGARSGATVLSRATTGAGVAVSLWGVWPCAFGPRGGGFLRSRPPPRRSPGACGPTGALPTAPTRIHRRARSG